MVVSWVLYDNQVICGSKVVLWQSVLCDIWDVLW